MATNFLKIKPCIRPILMRSISSSPARYNLVNLSVDDKTGIATLELNRPPVNSLNTALLQDISTALTDISKNRSKGLILTSVCTIFNIHTFYLHSDYQIFDFIRKSFRPHRQFFRPAWISWKCTNLMQKG